MASSNRVRRTRVRQQIEVASTPRVTVAAGVTPLTLYTVPEAANLLHLSVSKTWALACSGALASCKIGRSRRVGAGAIARFIERMQVAAEEGDDGSAA
jgi:excisionase family DNA binding protein